MNEAREIVATEELFKVEYDFGNIIRLMKQTYTNKPPFYYRLKEPDFTNVETSSNNIQDIIDYYKRYYKFETETIKDIKEKEVKDIYIYHHKKTKEFLDKLIEVQKKERLLDEF